MESIGFCGDSDNRLDDWNVFIRDFMGVIWREVKKEGEAWVK